MLNLNIGYTRKQESIETLKSLGCDRVVFGCGDGSSILPLLSEGDTVTCLSFYDMAESYDHIRQFIQNTISKGVEITFKDNGMTINESVLDVVIKSFEVYKDVQLEFKREKQLEGIAKAKARGCYKGRTKNVKLYNAINALSELGISQRNISKQLNVSLSTVNRAVKTTKAA